VDSPAVDGRPYVGSDRRHRIPPSRRELRHTHVVALAATVFTVGLALPVLLASTTNLHTIQLVHMVTRSAASGVFVGAGLLQLVRWKLTGEATSATRGAAALVFGALLGVSGYAAPLIHEHTQLVANAGLPRALAVAATLPLFSAALRFPPVVSTLRPTRLVAAPFLGAAALTLVAIALHAQGVAFDWTTGGWQLIEIVAAGGWGLLAGAYLRSGYAQHQVRDIWAGGALGVMCLSELLRAGAIDQLYPFGVAAAALQLIAAVVIGLNAAAELQQVNAMQGSQLLQANRRLYDAEQHLAEARSRQQERAHDARAALTAVRAATATLMRYREHIDDGARSSLEHALEAELVRLVDLVDPRERPATAGVPFSVAEAISPVIAAQRAVGTKIHTSVRNVTALGRASDLAQVLQSLLVNARLYAPGSAVDVTAASHDDRVVLRVEDRGPGVPAVDRDRIFGRGERGAKSGQIDGDGLGLYIAERLVRGMGGDIEVQVRPGGGASFVVTLPVPARVSDGPQQEQQIIEVTDVQAVARRSLEARRAARVEIDDRRRPRRPTVALIHDQDVEIGWTGPVGVDDDDVDGFGCQRSAQAVAQELRRHRQADTQGSGAHRPFLRERQ
jgi:signal transduction histidine kinase